MTRTVYFDARNWRSEPCRSQVPSVLMQTRTVHVGGN